MSSFGLRSAERWFPFALILCALYILNLLFIKSNVNYDYKSPLEPNNEFTFSFKSAQYPDFEVEEIHGSPLVSFEKRMTANVKSNERRRLILSWDIGHSQVNFGGCPDWNCEFTADRRMADQADVVVITKDFSYERRTPKQLLAFYSQESPKNYNTFASKSGYFNVSLGYRRDTLGSSPYGYTVKLSCERPLNTVLNKERLLKKTKGAAWFVSHCNTNSKREEFVSEFKKLFPVDVYGSCRGMPCERGGECERMLDTDYHFYMALENSICSDYLTEKLWSQGYERDVVPVVLKRSIVEHLLPPNSFIAVDDYSTLKEMADQLKSLMDNKTAYLEFFSWRRNYKTVYLNGAKHDSLERPWGFCQLCRLAWLDNPPEMIIDDFKTWWDGSCEMDGQTVKKILSGS